MHTLAPMNVPTDNFVVEALGFSKSFTTWQAANRCARGFARRGQWATVGNRSGKLLKVCKPRQR